MCFQSNTPVQGAFSNLSMVLKQNSFCMDDRRQSEPIVQQFHSDNEGQGGAGHVNGKYLHWGRMNHFKTDSKPSVPIHASSEMQQEKQCEGPIF